MKVSELSGELLDYWVTRAEGKVETFSEWRSTRASYWRPSTMPNIAVPIIEREEIATYRYDDWVALAKPDVYPSGALSAQIIESGPTLLIAAMRCYVASKFGGDVPDEELA